MPLPSQLLHDVLANRMMDTDKVIQKYYQTLADFQSEAPVTKGTVTVMVGYMREKQAVELKREYRAHRCSHTCTHCVSFSLLLPTVVRASSLPPMTMGKSCDAYLKMSLLLPDKGFSAATRQKSRVYKQSLNPVLDDLFSL